MLIRTKMMLLKTRKEALFVMIYIGKDGELLEGDQILAIDGQVLDANISHQQEQNINQLYSTY